MKKTGLIILFFITMLQATPQSQQVNFTLEDRDRIMRTEEQVQSLRNEMNAKFESLDAKFEAIDTKFEAVDSKIETLYWGFGILITLMLFLFGFIIWDRRTSINPVQNKPLSLEERISRIEFVLREQAKNDPELAEILKKVGML